MDLCGGTGSWSRPYKNAGYDVRVINTPGYDVIHWREYPDLVSLIEGGGIYGILAAPPCTMFSMARTTAKTPRDMQTGFKVALACLEIIWECQYDGKKLAFWALENPKARMRWFLGIPALTFNPYDFGDAIRKPTDIFGNFNTKLRKKAVELDPTQKKHSHMNMQTLQPLPEGFVTPPDMNRRAAARSQTHPGFAKAFFGANK